MAKRKPNTPNRRPDRAHSARQKIEHYTTLAESARRSGDAVLAESYFQHAEHYIRTLNADQTAAQ